MNFGFSKFGQGFGPFLAKQVRSLGSLKGLNWVRSSVLVDEPGFESVLKFDLSNSKQFEVRYNSWVRSNTSQMS